MGVKDLWSVLAPVGHHMSLKHLSGQTLAVDLSIWVCETQGVKKMQGVVTKPHLRYMKGPITQVYASFFLPHYFDQCMYLFYVMLLPNMIFFLGDIYVKTSNMCNY